MGVDPVTDLVCSVGRSKPPTLKRGSEEALATEINASSDDRIGGYRYVRTIHPGATSVVMEVLHEGTQRRFALKQLLASRAADRDEYLPREGGDPEGKRASRGRWIPALAGTTLSGLCASIGAIISKRLLGDRLTSTPRPSC